MKWIYSLALALFVISTTSSFANPRITEDKIKIAFEKQFAGAQNINWQKQEKEITSVAFTWGDHRTIAYFNNEGELLGTMRIVFFDQLPLAVTRSFYSKFEKATIMSVKEITNQEGIHYIVSLENKKRHYHTTIALSGQIIGTERVKTK